MPNLVAYPPNTTDVKTFGNIVAVVGAVVISKKRL